MEILDQDMQMVRDFLLQWGAPEYIKGHFENLVSEHAKAQEEISELQEQDEELEGKESKQLSDLQVELSELQDTLDDICGEGMRGALETVRYWLHDVLGLKRPMQTPPRAILRIVEDVL